MRFLLILLAILATVWVIPFLLSVESGLKFGWPYQILFSLLALFGGFLFYLLDAPSMSPMKSTARALVGVVLVFVASIGIVVLFANLSPQFTFEEKEAEAAMPQERGKALFNDPNLGCFLCHTVAGSGGTRGPDLTHIATRAGTRRPGMSAEDYLKESLLNPGAYVVPPYDNIMPPLAQRLSADQLRDLLSYLLSLK